MNENTQLDELELVVFSQSAVVSKFADILSPVCTPDYEVPIGDQNFHSLSDTKLTNIIETIKRNTQRLNSILARLEI